MRQHMTRPAICLVLALAACSTAVRAPVTTPTDSAAAGGAPSGAAPASHVASSGLELVKSPNDDRSYRYLTLDNELRVLLVSDPDTDKAAASLVVFRGSYDEGDQYPGLAHFLEHMLFIATEKYPEVDAYQAFIGQHGGSSNAYTAGDHTNYFFDIKPEQFRPAMDRFAQFFISPLFDAEYVDREKNAVNSEYQLQLKADEWRASAVMREVMNPAHPESRFSIGSLETLGDGVREALVDFFETNYSADQMVLVALSNEPLDELQSWVAPMFSQVKDRRLGPSRVGEPMFLPADLPSVVRYRTIKDGYKVAYNFPVPGIEPHYREKPADYLSNLLGHEGAGSLHQWLTGKGWIESLSAGTGSFDDANSLLVVDMELTDAGYEHLDEITAALFDYIALLRKSPPQAWRYHEQARMAELAFRFQEPSSATAFVYQVGPRFQDYPPAEVLAAPYLMEDFDPDLIGTYLDALTPGNLVMEVAGPDVPVDKTERWFQVPYEVESGTVPRGPVDTAALSLPAPNPYLPETLDVLPDDEAPPRLAVARPGLALWSDRDTEFDTPRANLYLSLGIPGGIDTARDLAMASLYAKVVRDTLSEAVYPAYLAGLGYRLDVDGYGFELAVSGYSDKQLTLLATVLRALTDGTVDPARFAVLRDEIVRDWQNFRDERPYTQAYGALPYLLMSSRWPPEMLVEALAGCTAQDLERWHAERAARFHVLGLDHGNVPVEAAWALASVLQEHLDLSAFPRVDPRVIEVASAHRYRLEVDHQDAAMVAYLQDARDGVEARARSSLAAAMIQQAYFTSLRTEQQLGYVVAVTNQALRNRGGLAFVVQSPVASAADLERATQRFLDGELETARAMPREAFDSYKAGLIASLTERDRNLAERGNRLWTNLTLGVTSFDLRRQIAAEVSKLSKADMVDYLGDTAARFSSDRLVVYSNGRFDEAPTVGTALGSVQDFKRRAGS